MKLSWFNTSEAHKQYQSYIRYEYDAMQDIKEREFKDSGSIANKKMFHGPPSHRRIFTITFTQDFPHREHPLRIWVIQTGSIQLLSPTNTTSSQEARHNNDHLYT